MSWITDNLKQTVVYWANPVPDGYGGFTFDTPVELSGRWEYRNDLFIDGKGREVRSSAVVYVSEDVAVGGWLFLGELIDLTSDWSIPNEAKEIRGFRKVPDLDAVYFERKAWL